MMTVAPLTGEELLLVATGGSQVACFPAGETGVQIAQQNIIFDGGFNRNIMFGYPGPQFSGLGLENFFWHNDVE